MFADSSYENENDLFFMEYSDFSYRFRLGISRGLTHRGGVFPFAIALHSGVENCSRFEPPPPFRFKIGVATSADVVVVASVRFIILISIRSFALEAMPAAIAEVVGVHGAVAFAPPEFVLIAIFVYAFIVDNLIQYYAVHTQRT